MKPPVDPGLMPGLCAEHTRQHLPRGCVRHILHHPNVTALNNLHDPTRVRGR